MDLTVPSYGLIEWEADDGVRLAARIYGAGTAGAEPLVCLPGLTRNARDFEALAAHFATHASVPRQVIAIDSRGRGASGWAPPETYQPMREAEDVAAGLAFAGVSEASFIGTSRGGMLVLLLAAMRPGLVKRAVLNELGPTIEIPGLVRIAEQLRGVRPMADWHEAAAAVAAAFATVYPAFSAAEWERFARQLCRETDGRVVYDYDPQLVSIFDRFDPATFHLDLWPAFDGLRTIPVMVIRGALSDILSAATVEAMIRRHPGLEACVVPGQGHAPVLWERSILERISRFLSV